MAPKKPVIDSIYDFSPKGMMELVLELQKWFRHRNGPAGPVGPIDSTENVGDLWGVHSTETDGAFEAEGSVLRADGVGGSLWGGVPSGGVSLEDVIRASSLSGFWKFDESSGTTAADSSGNGYDLTAGSFTAPTWAQTAGPPGTQTAAWSSSAQGVSRSSYPSVASAGFSVFGWVYLASDSATDLHFLLGQGQNLFGVSGVIGWSLGVGGVGNYGRKLLLGTGNNSALDLRVGDNTLALNTWYHVGFVYSSGVSTMYVNGAAQSDTTSQVISTGAQTLTAGNDIAPNIFTYLRGRLSWWAVWDTALTAAQVFNQYTVGANPTGAPVGYLIESDGSGSTRWIPADEIALTDVTSGNASTTKHGWAKKLSGVATEFFRGDGTYAAVTDAILSTSDVTTNNATTSKHGFLKKLSNVATEVMNGAGNWIGVVTGLSKSGSTVLTGAVTLTGGSNVTLTQTSQDITIAATVVGSGAVDSVAKSGSTPLTGAVTLSGGTGITLTQAANNIAIASSGVSDGWQDDTTETWTYASGSGGGVATFTISGDQTAKYTFGTRIKLTQTSVKYFVCSGSSVAGGTTTVTIMAGTDYTLANAAISANYHSYHLNPQGWPDWFNYTSTLVGWSGTPPTKSSRFAVHGNVVFIKIDVSGTSNAQTTTFTVPFASAATFGSQQVCVGTDNGAILNNPSVIYTDANATTFRVFVNFGTGTLWTASSTKAIRSTFMYQAA